VRAYFLKKLKQRSAILFGRAVIVVYYEEPSLSKISLCKRTDARRPVFLSLWV